MNKNYFKSVFPASILLLGSGFFMVNGFTGSGESVYQPRKESAEAQLADPAAEEYVRTHKNHFTGNVERADFERAWAALQPMVMNASERAVGLEWSEEGPDNVGGRTRAILVNRSNPNIVFAGSVTGGLYKSTDRGGWWTRVTSFDDVVLTGSTGTSLAISATCQDLNGRIYVGTGCAFEGGVTFGQMQNGNGIYYSDDLGATWTQLTTTPSLTTQNINELQADPNQADRIWIGSNRVYTYDPTAGLVQKHTSASLDLKLSPDGMMVISSSASACIVSNDYGATFTTISGSGPTQIATSNMRVEFGVSFEKNSLNNWSVFAMCSKTSGLTEGYISNDNGNTWNKTLPANGLINPVGTQGNYNNTVAGIPGHPDRFFMGGIDTYHWEADPDDISEGQIEQRSFWFLDNPNPFYVHADNHEIEWATDLKQAYIGNDGGVGRSADNNMNIFYTSNRGYNVTQFYSVAYSGRGDVMGGTQDNGTNYNDHSHSFYQSFVEVRGGDGFDCDISQIDPSYMFGSVYYGGMQRSNNYGSSFSDFYNARILSFGDPGSIENGIGQFKTVGRLYENENDLNSTDTLTIRNNTTDTIYNGQTTTIYFGHSNYSLLDSIAITATQDYLPGDSITYIVDRIQTLYAMGFTGAERGVWITRGACNFAANPIWDSIPGITSFISSSEAVVAIEFSANGNHMFVSTTGGDLIRVSGLNSYYGGTGGRDMSGLTVTRIGVYTGSVQGIAIDPNNVNHIVLCIGGFGSSTILEINNATTAPTSASATGSDITGAGASGLPSMPVYDGVIDVSDATGNTIIVGTEYGVYSTDNGGISWTYESGGIGGAMGPGPVPVTAVRQQSRPWSNYTKNPGVIYIGTMGRGIWKSETLLSIGNDPMDDIKPNSSLLNLAVYPNPASDFANIEFTLAKDANDVLVNVFSLNGTLVSTQNINRAVKGKNNLTLNVNEYAKGTYLVAVIAGKNKFTNKLVVR